MTQINRVPRGLQDLLNTQSFGKNPDQLGQVVQPVLDISAFYRAEKLEVVRTQKDNLAVGDEILTQIPVGENWFVVAFGRGINDIVPTDNYSVGSYIDLNQRQDTEPSAFLLEQLEWTPDKNSDADLLYKSTFVREWFPSGTTFQTGLTYAGSTIPFTMDLVQMLLIVRLAV